MTILFAIAFISFWVWFPSTFSKFAGVVIAPAIGYWCFNWGLNFTGSEFTHVTGYGWFFIGLGVWMVLVVLATIYEIVEDIRLHFTPEPVCQANPYDRVETKSKRHWGMHKQN